RFDLSYDRLNELRREQGHALEELGGAGSARWAATAEGGYRFFVFSDVLELVPRAYVMGRRFSLEGGSPASSENRAEGLAVSQSWLNVGFGLALRLRLHGFRAWSRLGMDVLGLSVGGETEPADEFQPTQVHLELGFGYEVLPRWVFFIESAQRFSLEQRVAGIDGQIQSFDSGFLFGVRFAL
ncbi:MAG: hypothetical protein AAFY60_21480, partial [Myxococcota bacterium]